jgi:hypothetical protein
MFAMGNPPFRPVKEIECALERGDLRMAIAIAKDFTREHGRPIPLAVALKLLPLVASQSPREFDAYALRWLTRWIDETPAGTIEQAAHVAGLLADMPSEPGALRELADH